ncbi:MAG: hypothetical protein ACR2HJ_04620 [Fimbriimonadales bacterium]
MIKYFSLTLLALIGISCGPSAPGGATRPEAKVLQNAVGSGADFMPLAEGNSWTYELTQMVRDKAGKQSRGVAEMTFKVTNVVDHGTGKRALVTVYNKTKPISTLSFLSNPKGVFQTSLRGKNLTAVFEPPLPLIHWPSKVGQKRMWAGVGYMAGLNKTGKVKMDITYKGLAEVDTPSGRMKAHRVDVVQSYAENGKKYGTTQSMWFVPKIGLVRSLDLVSGVIGTRQSDMKLISSTRK